MGFESREISIQSGEPIELYLFAIGNKEYTYTSTTFDVEYDYKTYEPVAIHRGNIEVSDESNKNSIIIEVSRDNTFALDFFVGSEDRAASLTIFRGHVDEDEFITVWKGRVSNVSFKGDEVEISCESVFTSLKRQGLRAKYQQLCRHVLYSPQCGVLGGEHKVATVISSSNIDGNQLSIQEVAEYEDGYFNSGYILVGNYIFRYILAHTGETLILNKALPEFSEAMGTDIYPGCNHTSDHCKDKFDNIENFGGFEFIPSINPFSTLGSSLM